METMSGLTTGKVMLLDTYLGQSPEDTYISLGHGRGTSSEDLDLVIIVALLQDTFGVHESN